MKTEKKTVEEVAAMILSNIDEKHSSIFIPLHTLQKAAGRKCGKKFMLSVLKCLKSKSDDYTIHLAKFKKFIHPCYVVFYSDKHNIIFKDPELQPESPVEDSDKVVKK